MTDPTLPWVTRFWFAWVCWFHVLFDGRFAARAFALRAGAPAELPRSGLEPAAAAPEPPVLKTQAPLQTGNATGSSHSDSEPALQLLGLLQREGRLIDFLQQDLTGFGDPDIGAAARVVHEGCRKALRTHARIQPIRAEAEGAAVVLEPGFDAAAVKLTGNLAGSAPYRGTLRHRGWRVEALDLPTRVAGHDARVVAPAEVEL